MSGITTLFDVLGEFWDYKIVDILVWEMGEGEFVFSRLWMFGEFFLKYIELPLYFELGKLDFFKHSTLDTITLYV